LSIKFNDYVKTNQVPCELAKSFVKQIIIAIFAARLWDFMPADGRKLLLNN
jgi:hypothetical protein